MFGMSRFSLLLVSVLIVGIASPVSAITNHNLSWGFEVGNQFHFRDSELPFGQVVNYYMEIDSIPEESDRLVGTEFGESDYCTFYNEDGSEMEDTPNLVPVSYTHLTLPTN